MIEIVSRVFLTVLFMAIAVPLVCLVATPYVLASALFQRQTHWHTVKRTYRQLIRGTIDWGTGLFQP